MSELLATLNAFLKAQLVIHGDQVWLALAFLTPAFLFIWGMTSIAKGFLTKWLAKGKFRDSAIRLCVLVWGVAFMGIHGAFFPQTFVLVQKICGGVFLGGVHIAVYHLLKWWKNRKAANG
jgi:hypothetical protein